MFNCPRLFTAVVFAAFSCLSPAAEVEIVLQNGLDHYAGTSDASLYEELPSNSNGGGDVLFSGVTAQGNARRALVRFDLSRVPKDALIEDARLSFFVDRVRTVDEPYAVHRLKSSWGEGSVDAGDPGGQGAAAVPGDATWSSRFLDDLQWSVAGGDFITTPSATATVGGDGEWYDFESGDLAADVQAWVDGAVENSGWILIGNEAEVFNAKRFISSESPFTDFRPKLTLLVSYEESAPEAILDRQPVIDVLDRNDDSVLDAADAVE